MQSTRQSPRYGTRSSRNKAATHDSVVTPVVSVAAPSSASRRKEHQGASRSTVDSRPLRLTPRLVTTVSYWGCHCDYGSFWGGGKLTTRGGRVVSHRHWVGGAIVFYESPNMGAWDVWGALNGLLQFARLSRRKIRGSRIR